MAYNNAQAQTRTRIEQAFGVLKRRFHCLHDEIRVDPNKACQIIVACVVLNNIALARREDELPLIERDRYVVQPLHDDTVSGRMVRDNLRRRYFP